MAGLRTLSIISSAGHYARWRSYVKLEFKGQQSVEEAPAKIDTTLWVRYSAFQMSLAESESRLVPESFSGVT
jgi:hypothetical protein